MSKHTPWKTGHDLFGALHVYDSDGDRLTNDRMSRSEDWYKTARLIAAAPDLLEALRSADKFFNAHLEPGDEDTWDYRMAQEIKAAIAKAEGRS